MSASAKWLLLFVFAFAVVVALVRPRRDDA
jgi:hypothetical protein